MKVYLMLLSLLAYSGQSVADDVLRNCFSERSAQFFTSELEDIAQDNATPVLLLNQKDEVVGVISVSAQRADQYPHYSSVVKVNKMRLCSTLEVDDFYYADGDAQNLLKWMRAGTVGIDQDEGMIIMSTTLARKETYASLYKVEFKTYEVSGEVDEDQNGHPDYIEDWGLPVGRGEFYFSLPANWIVQ